MKRNHIVIAALCLVAGFLAGNLTPRLDRVIGSWRKEKPGPTRERPSPALIAQALAAADRDPRDMAAQRKVADLYLKAGSFEEAEKRYARVLVLDPQDTEALLNRGYCLWKIKRLEDAMDAFRMAERGAPGDYRPWYNMAVVLCDLEKPEEARKAFDVAVRLKPDLPGRDALRESIEELEKR